MAGTPRKNGKSFVSPWNYDPEVTSGFNFPRPKKSRSTTSPCGTENNKRAPPIP